MFYCLTPNIEDHKSKNNLWQKATPCFKFYTTEMHDQRERDGDVYTCKNKCGSCCKKWQASSALTVKVESLKLLLSA